jgi:hypothetical protein
VPASDSVATLAAAANAADAVTTKPWREIHVETSPPEAMVKRGDTDLGASPTILLKNSDTADLVVSAPGYEMATLRLDGASATPVVVRLAKHVPSPPSAPPHAVASRPAPTAAQATAAPPTASTAATSTSPTKKKCPNGQVLMFGNCEKL